jgi:hypothetical protein
MLLFCHSEEQYLFIEQFVEILSPSEWQICEFVVTGLYYAIIFVLLNEASLFNEQFAEILFVRMTILWVRSSISGFYYAPICHAEARRNAVYWTVCWDSSFRMTILWVSSSISGFYYVPILSFWGTKNAVYLATDSSFVRMTNLWVRSSISGFYYAPYFVILRNKHLCLLSSLLRFFLRQNDKFVSS